MYAVAGHGERAACLVEAGVIIRDSSGVPQPPPERDETEAAVVPARRALGEAAWAAAFAAGQAMTLEEAVAEALHVSPRSATPPHAEFTEIANRGR